MAGYIGTQPVPQATQTRDAFTCTAGQTSFATSGYTPGFLDVYLNGIKLAAADYTASNGSDVVLASGAALDDILEVVAYTSFEVVTDTVTNAGTVLNLDRTGSDGTILDLKKDGTTVGSIGIHTDGFYIDGEANHAGIRFGGNNISPRDGGVDTGDQISLGQDVFRFNNLYLSGGAYLGGVGAANRLDDYEEGTWTPAFLNVSLPTYTVQTGNYTKIGRLVHVTISIEYSGLNTGDASSLAINLPFAASASGVFHIAESGSSTGFAGSNTISLIGSTGAGSTSVAFGSTGDYNDGDYDSGNWNQAGRLRFAGSYPAS